VSAASLQAELNRRQHGVRRLETRRATLAAKLAKLDEQIRAHGGAASGRVPRARNKVSLVEALAQTLKGKTLGVAEAADAVLATGYTSNAANFRLIVNQTLLKNKQFKKVSRGQYTVK
jgi:hypothetical protein